jgi:hypothetical protein
MRPVICYSKSNEDFEPYHSYYEAWSGNAGNTMDKWYHRAALVMWKQKDHDKILSEAKKNKSYMKYEI